MTIKQNRIQVGERTPIVGPLERRPLDKVHADRVTGRVFGDKPPPAPPSISQSKAKSPPPPKIGPPSSHAPLSKRLKEIEDDALITQGTSSLSLEECQPGNERQPIKVLDEGDEDKGEDVGEEEGQQDKEQYEEGGEDYEDDDEEEDDLNALIDEDDNEDDEKGAMLLSL